jgi:anti-anti-sigma regulatory factor
MSLMTGTTATGHNRRRTVSVQLMETAGAVNCVHLADGKLVQLSGRIGQQELTSMRLALLTPLPDDCRDVVVDAGEVEDVDDAAVAVLVAAREWAATAGARLLLSRSAPALDRVLDELDMTDEIPRLGAVAPARLRPL